MLKINHVLLALILCTQISHAHQPNIKQTSEQGDYYNKVIAIEPIPVKIDDGLVEDSSKIKPLSDFAKTSKTWGDDLIKSPVPKTGYLTYYFDIQNPKHIVWQGHKQKAIITPIQNRDLGVPEPNFAGFWAKKITLDQETDYRLDMDVNFARVRVSIDKHIVFDENSTTPYRLLRLPKGEHLLEIEYISNQWTMISFKAQLQPLADFKPAENPDKMLKHIKSQHPNVQAYYAGVYEATEDEIDVYLDQLDKPTVLFLSSYKPVIWNIHQNNPYLVGVVYHSAVSESIVRGIDPAILVHSSEELGGYSATLSPNCSCENATFSCEYFESLFPDFDDLYQSYQIPIAGFDGDYYANRFDLPKYRLLNHDYKKLDQDFHRLIKKQEKTCKTHHEKEFGEVFQ